MRSPSKLQRFSALGCRALTLLELLVATAISSVVAGIIFTILSTGLNLFAKNTGVNFAHQEARVALQRLERDVHLAASVPVLLDKNGVSLTAIPDTPDPLNPVGYAAGVSFQMFAAGPFKVLDPAKIGGKSIHVATNGYQPRPGQRFCLPEHGFEATVVSVTDDPISPTITFTPPLDKDVPTELLFGGVNKPVVVVGFFADHIVYLVKNQTLVVQSNAGGEVVLAHGVTNATPFRLWYDSGKAQTDFIQVAEFSTEDFHSSNRPYRMLDMLLNATSATRATIMVKN